MDTIFTAIPYPFSRPNGKALLKALLLAFPSTRAAMAIAEDAGLFTGEIGEQEGYYFTWRKILQQAAAQGLLQAVVTAARDRLNAASPVYAVLTSLLEGKTIVGDAEPVSAADGAPRFIEGNDNITHNEALLYRDDLTLQVGRLPNLIAALQHMATLIPAVCKLNIDVNGEPQFGTAFRIGEDQLLTNWHVIHKDDGTPATVIIAEFGYEDNGQGAPVPSTFVTCATAPIIEDKDDDWAIVRSTQPLDPAWPVISLSEAVVPKENTLAFIIQHPLGERKRLGYVRNSITRVEPRVVQYLTDTNEGSSGAPVFNSEGKLIALHHAGGRPQEVLGRPPVRKNEGIRISRITDVLTEKGIPFT